MSNLCIKNAKLGNALLIALSMVCAVQSANAQAPRAALTETCLSFGGKPVESLNRSGQDLGLCRFDEAFIGSNYLRDIQAGFYPKPLLSFLNRVLLGSQTRQSPSDTCRKNGGSLEEISAPIGQSLFFCRFDERGGMSADSFQLGADAIGNRSLVNALSILIPQAIR